MLNKMLLLASGLMLLAHLGSPVFAATDPETFVVHFALNSARIDADAKTEIAALADFLRRHPDLGIAIGGHTDSSGPQALNQRLSKARANTIRVALINQHHIEPQRLSINGLADQLAVANNQTEAGRAKNRRAEILFSGPLIHQGKSAPRLRPAGPAMQRSDKAPPAPSRNQSQAAESLMVSSKGDRKTDGGVRIGFTPEGNFLSKQSLGELTKIAQSLKKNPNQQIKVTGVLSSGQRDRATLRQLRTRIDLVRSTLIYGHSLPASQVGSGWVSEPVATPHIEIR